MKTIFSVIVVFLFCGIIAQAQQTKKAPKKPVNTQKLTVSGINTAPKKDTSNFGKLKIKVFDQKSPAYFPKGDIELFSIIAHELKYTDADKEKKVDGKVLIRFDVDADSSVKEVRLIKDPCMDCGKEIVRIFEKLKFVPATTANGTFVRTNVMLEIPVWAH